MEWQGEGRQLLMQQEDYMLDERQLKERRQVVFGEMAVLSVCPGENIFPTLL